MNKFKKALKNKRIIILIVFLIISILLIRPAIFGSNDGVAIRSVAKDSAAAKAYPKPVLNPGPTTKPMDREVIFSVNNIKVHSVKEYYNITKAFKINETFTLETNKDTYFITVQPKINRTATNKTELVWVNRTIVNQTTNETTTKQVQVEKEIYENKIIGKEPIGITVYKRPTSNIKKGLDLEGGTRVLLEPESQINKDDMDLMVESIKKRLNVFGVSDVTVRPTKDFFGKQFISVEIAGTNEEQIKQLLTNQGEFQAKIGDQVVFNGGNKDIVNVCRSQQCSFLEPERNCQQGPDGSFFCSFWFQITLNQAAADRQASITRDIPLVGDYLVENLSLILDGEQVDQLRISSGLKGIATTTIRISGSGTGSTPKLAHEDALDSMKSLQTILITGSLPVKLKVANVETISPVLGEEFTRAGILAGILAIIAVIFTVVIRYRELKISIPIAITMISEVIILLGFAAFIGWNIDLVAIAAIIIAVGSGVDDQIVITDETLGRRKKGESSVYDWKEKMKKAFFIIMASYFTLVVAMIPLMFAGAGLLLGFAITTIAGVTIGVLITRPAFAEILELLLEK